MFVCLSVCLRSCAIFLRYQKKARRRHWLPRLIHKLSGTKEQHQTTSRSIGKYESEQRLNIHLRMYG
jgi:hypothetical protein